MEMNLNILVQAHLNYSYLDATVVQGFKNLGHNVFSVNENRACYLHNCPVWSNEPIDVSIQNLRGASPLPGRKSILVWGLDSHEGLGQEFARKGLFYNAFFVRDCTPEIESMGKERGIPVFPFSFGIEDRYIQQSLKPFNQRTIDIFFSGAIYGWRLSLLNRIKRDFKSLNLALYGKVFNTPDDVWTPHTLPYTVHDPSYFEALNNSRVALSLHGAGPDCARHYEVLASGAIPMIQRTRIAGQEPLCLMFDDYPELKRLIEDSLRSEWSHSDTSFNITHHSTQARAQYILDCLES